MEMTALCSKTLQNIDGFFRGEGTARREHLFSIAGNWRPLCVQLPPFIRAAAVHLLQTQRLDSVTDGLPAGQRTIFVDLELIPLTMGQAACAADTPAKQAFPR